jgi:hypothetical protein
MQLIISPRLFLFEILPTEKILIIHKERKLSTVHATPFQFPQHFLEVKHGPFICAAHTVFKIPNQPLSHFLKLLQTFEDITIVQNAIRELPGIPAALSNKFSRQMLRHSYFPDEPKNKLPM